MDTHQFDQDKIILEPYNYLVTQTSGKQFRDMLIQSLNYWLKVSDSNLSIISKIIDLLHNPSLMIDDIEDNSLLRRGIPAAHTIYGLRQTLNAANYCYFLSLQTVIKEFPKENSNKAVEIFTKQLLKSHVGQGMDIYYRDNSVCPTEEQYLKIARGKTGALLGLVAQLMQLLSDCKYDLTELIDLLADYYQIRDDYGNLKSNQYTNIKGFAEDLTEGKYSLPVIHAINNYPNDSVVHDIVKKKTNDSELKLIAIKKMETLGSFEYCIKRMNELDTQLVKIIDSFGGNPKFTKILEMFRNIDFKQA